MPKIQDHAKGLTLLFAVIFMILTVAGCVIIINKPSPEEQELLAIQDTVGQQMSQLSQKVSSGNSSSAEIEDFIAQMQNTVNQAVQRIHELNIPARTKQFADATLQYLDSARKIFEQVKSMLSDLDKLKSQGQQAGAAIQQQISSIQSGISSFSGQLNQIAGQLQSARQQILDLYKNAK